MAFSTGMSSDEISFRMLKVTTVHFGRADLRQGWGGRSNGIRSKMVVGDAVAESLVARNKRAGDSIEK